MIHGAFLFAASRFVGHVVIDDGEPEVVMALDLRSTNFLPRAEERVRETTSGSRQVIPSPPASPLLEPQSTPPDLSAQLADDDEFATSDVIASFGGTRTSSVGGTVSVQRLRKQAAPVASAGTQSTSAAPATPNGSGTSEASNTYSPPAIAASPAIEYPSQSRRSVEEGDVKCRIRVSARGLVEAVEIVLSSGFSRLDEAARLGLSAWRFKPATRDGAPCACVVDHVVTFRLSSAATGAQ